MSVKQCPAYQLTERIMSLNMRDYDTLISVNLTKDEIIPLHSSKVITWFEKIRKS